jgi:hypothetical protein
VSAEGEAAAGRLADHLKNCRGVDAVIAGDGNLDEVVNTMIAAGWTFNGVEYVEGKRVRYLVPPPGWRPEDGTP